MRYTAAAPSARRRTTLQSLHPSTVLVVDDEELYRRALERILLRVGHQVATAPDAGEALQVIASERIDLVLCDIQMPGINGLELVRQIHDVAPDVPCIVMTGYNTPENSLEALQAGAFWYLEKPFEQERLDVVRKLVDKAIEHGRLKSENRSLQRQLQSRHKFDSIIGKSPSLGRTLSVVEKVADTESTVLITGESGTGKELVARAIHQQARVPSKPFVARSTAARSPRTLLESELFGHEKGAFTGAAKPPARPAFEAADGGTIFLDEVGEMSPPAHPGQAAARAAGADLRARRLVEETIFAQSRRARHRGDEPRPAEAMVEDGHASARISIYRLNVMPVEMPAALAIDRVTSLLLVDHFLDRHGARGDRELHEVSAREADDCVLVSSDYRWPGNVRELENVIERLTVLVGEGDIEIEDLPAQVRAEPISKTLAPRVPSTGLDFNAVVGRFETELIEQALDHTHWNKNRAAGLLGLNRTTLIEKIKKRRIQPPDED